MSFLTSQKTCCSLAGKKLIVNSAALRRCVFGWLSQIPKHFQVPNNPRPSLPFSSHHLVGSGRGSHGSPRETDRGHELRGAPGRRSHTSMEGGTGMDAVELRPSKSLQEESEVDM